MTSALWLLPGLPPPAAGWGDRIATAFRSDRRRLFLSPVSPSVELRVIRAPRTGRADPETIDAELKKRTDVVFSSDGVRSVELRCKTTSSCKVDLSPPPTEREGR